MQRIIKFRAWDKLNSVMQNMHAMEFLARTETRNQDRFVLMQFTGLTDKNGKDVFEGDVLQTEPERPICPLTVRYDEKTAMFRAFGKNKNPHTDLPLLHYKAKFNLIVIGNIYENPDLLKL